MDPQIVVGLLVTPTGFPLEVHAFTGNTAETVTLIPVLRSFRRRGHPGPGSFQSRVLVDGFSVVPRVGF